MRNKSVTLTPVSIDFELLRFVYLTAKKLIPESLKSIGQFTHAEFNEKSYMSLTDGNTDGPTRIIEKKNG